MNKRALTRWILLFGGYVFCAISAAAGDAKVRGKVVDQDGAPVSHAYVEASPMLDDFDKGTVGIAGDRPNPWTAADDSGQFELVLAPGRYRIEGKAELRGFPDPTFLLNADPKAQFPVISVDHKHVGELKVILGRRGGILHGLVQDSDTHTAIFNAKVRIQDADNANAFVEVFTNRSGRYQYTVSGKPILISVDAKGYRALRVENDRAVVLAPGENREIDIALHHE